MMRSLPGTGITYCVCHDRAVFLDIERDRYFCLPSRLNGCFDRTAIDGDPMCSTDAERLDALGIEAIVPGEYAARQDSIPLPAREIAPTDPAASLLRVGAVHLLVRTRLKYWSFARLIAHERRRTPRRPSREISDPELAGLHAAFQCASIWLGEADQCLARSVAFRMLAFRRGLTPTLVMGVKLDPFSAHCWVQTGDCVANDSLERVRNFTPILTF